MTGPLHSESGCDRGLLCPSSICPRSSNTVERHPLSEQRRVSEAVRRMRWKSAWMTVLDDRWGCLSSVIFSSRGKETPRPPIMRHPAGLLSQIDSPGFARLNTTSSSPACESRVPVRPTRILDSWLGLQKATRVGLARIQPGWCYGSARLGITDVFTGRPDTVAHGETFGNIADVRNVQGN